MALGRPPCVTVGLGVVNVFGHSFPSDATVTGKVERIQETRHYMCWPAYWPLYGCVLHGSSPDAPSWQHVLRNLVAWNMADDAACSDYICEVLRRRRLMLRGPVWAMWQHVILAFYFNDVSREVIRKVEWTLAVYYEIHRLCWQPKPSGECIRVVAGHVVSHFMFRRCHLTCLEQVWVSIEATWF